MADAPTLIELAPFDRPAPGSFISALAALGDEARSRGWRCEIVVPEGARELDWIARLETAGMRVHFSLPPTRRERTRWLQAVASDRQGPTILHSHFNSWDVPAALVAPPERGATPGGTSTPSSGRVRLLSPQPVEVRVVRTPAQRCAVPGRGARARAELAGRAEPADPCRSERDRPVAIPPGHAEMRVESRRRLGIPEDAEVLLHFGWNWRHQGRRSFLAAVSASRARRADGERCSARAGRRDRAIEPPAARGIRDRVRPVGTVSRIAGPVRGVDVFLALSEREGGRPTRCSRRSRPAPPWSRPISPVTLSLPERARVPARRTDSRLKRGSRP